MTGRRSFTMQTMCRKEELHNVNNEMKEELRNVNNGPGGG